jgi:tRNA (mo5U34)-methyltransferase
VTGRRTWYHTIDLPNGNATPGYYDTRVSPPFVPWPRIEGARCLDVGTFDGFWAFEMERRGATEVIAIDIDDPEAIDWAYDHRTSGPAAMREWGSERGPGFRDAATALASRVEWKARSVYELDPAHDGTFDVVLCGALLLHLRDPVLALERMREVCHGSLVLVEAIDPNLELSSPLTPAAHFRPTSDEWWRVNSRGLRALVDVAGFQLLQISRRFIVPFGPGAPSDLHPSWLPGLAARRPGRRGTLMRALLAEPRAARDADSGNQ